MSKSIEGAIECPFYLEEGKSFIKCEGVLNGTITPETIDYEDYPCELTMKRWTRNSHAPL